MMFAVISTNGVQFVVARGDCIKIPAKIGEPGKTVEFDRILMFKDDDRTEVGRPFVEGVTVKGTVKKHGRFDKATVFKFIRRENYRRKRGHRQDYTEVEITAVQKAK